MNAMILKTTWVLRWALGVNSTSSVCFCKPPPPPPPWCCPLHFDLNSHVRWLLARQGPFIPANTTSKRPALCWHQSSTPARSQSRSTALKWNSAHLRPLFILQRAVLHPLPTLFSYSSPPQPLPQGDVITHFGGSAYPQSSTVGICSIKQPNSAVAKLLSRRVCHANVAPGGTAPRLKVLRQRCEVWEKDGCLWGWRHAIPNWWVEDLTEGVCGCP